MLRVKGQSFDQPDSIRMLRRELHINAIILAFGSSISLLSVSAADNEGRMLTDSLNPRIQHLQEGVIFPMTRILRRDDAVATVGQTHLKSDLKRQRVEFLSIPVRRHRFKHCYHFIPRYPFTFTRRASVSKFCPSTVADLSPKFFKQAPAWNVSELRKATMRTVSCNDARVF